MRLFWGMGIVVAVAIVIIVAADDRKINASTTADAACRQAAARLKIAAATGLIGLIRRSGPNLVVEVDRRQWMSMHRFQQVDLAMAVWCGVALEGGRGTVQFTDGSDDLGRVAKGEWSSKYGD